MTKFDITKADKAYFTAKKKPEVVTIKPAQYISISGKGDPSAPAFTNNIEALYPTAYAIKFAMKAKEKDFVVPKLEGLWWYDESRFKNKSIDNAASDVPRSEWEYRLLIRMPDTVTKKDISNAVAVVTKEKGIQAAGKIEFFEMKEGKCVQMLHVGPFADEPKTLKQMMAFMQSRDFERNGLHHEIYLSDFRRTEPSKLKTILREPVK